MGRIGYAYQLFFVDNGTCCEVYFPCHALWPLRRKIRIISHILSIVIAIEPGLNDGPAILNEEDPTT